MAATFDEKDDERNDEDEGKVEEAARRTTRGFGNDEGDVGR
jgi:hypothetical protein